MAQPSNHRDDETPENSLGQTLKDLKQIKDTTEQRIEELTDTHEAICEFSIDSVTVLNQILVCTNNAMHTLALQQGSSKRPIKEGVNHEHQYLRKQERAAEDH